MALQTESGPLEMAYNWHACPSAARLPKEPCFVLPQELVSCVPRFEVTALPENTHEFCVTTKPRSCDRLLPTLRRGSRSEREQAEARGRPLSEWCRRVLLEAAGFAARGWWIRNRPVLWCFRLIHQGWKSRLQRPRLLAPASSFRHDHATVRVVALPRNILTDVPF